MDNTGNSISSGMITETNNIRESEQATADPPQEYLWPSDDLCHWCQHLRMSVTLLPCQHAALCQSCAEVIMKQRKKECPFCKKRVTSIIRVTQ